MAPIIPPKPLEAKAASTVVIPMALQAFVVSEDFKNSEYQVAPLTQPNFDAQRPRIGELAHDIMDELDTSYWRMQASYNSRFVDLATGTTRKDRTGVYLSWCLPHVYRTGITATESATRSEGAMKYYNEERIKAGFNPKDKARTDVQFRSAPDRWIIIRHTLKGDASDCWVLVESNCVRDIDDDDLSALLAPDIENITSAAVNPDPQIGDESQHRCYLGRSMILDSDPSKGSQTRKYWRSFNAFETGNEFFADYQPHNTSVFSFFDDMTGAEDAVVDYTVIGYHSEAVNDPLAIFDVLKENNKPFTNARLLEALLLKLDPATGALFLEAPAGPGSRTLSHGILRNVEFNRATSVLKAPSITLQTTNYQQQPVAVGTNALDALAAYLFAFSGTSKSDTAVHKLLGQLVMLILRDDDVDSQRKAADEVSTNDWNTKVEETVWQLPKHNDQAGGYQGAEPAPPDTHRDMLTVLNNVQQQFDACVHEHLQLCQSLFGCWWNAIGLRNLPQGLHISRRAQIKQKAALVAGRLSRLKLAKDVLANKIASLKISLETNLKGKALVCASGKPFGIHQDPTVLFAGAKSGWPKGFQDPLPVRLASDIAPEPEPNTRKRIPNDQSLKKILPGLCEPILPLLRELAEPDQGKRDWKASAYVELEDMNKTQGWFPLFIEWEVEYYHVPFSEWAFEPDTTTGRWRYVIPEKTVLSASSVGVDCRVLHGRTAITPQPGKTLHARLKQLFAQTKSADLIQNQDKLLQDVANLEYFSSPLGGFTDHLLTLRRGPHPKPSASDLEVQKALGLTKDKLEVLQATSHELAPYGATTPLPPTYTSFSPFKPVTHGQARFTKLIIVDKFGQIVSGIRPGRPGHNPSALYPCVSPSLACGVIAGDSDEYYPNTAVKADQDANMCQFFQIPPRINQRARLNIQYMIPSADTSSQRVASEWDNPVWGWLLVNYQNYSIQFYNPKGDFTREVLLHEATKSTTFSVGPNVGNTLQPSGRLQNFVNSMRNYTFAKALFGMLSGAVDNIRSSSAGFEAMLPAAFGRPFCLADIGLSIELATPPLENVSLLTAPKEDREPEPDLTDYEFPVALGNYTAAFDGLVGTFPATGDIERIHTGYQWETVQDRTATIKVNFVPDRLYLKPYFIPGDPSDGNQVTHATQLKCVSTILDPKCPIHVYSGSLFPMVELSLPKWTTDGAIQNMHAFFAAGPILIPEKPQLDQFHIQQVDSGLNGGTGSPAPDPPSVQMPLGGPGSKWQWLQPRAVSDSETIWDPVTIRSLNNHLNVEAASGSELVDGFVLVQ